jgi:GNAT superfamily N-acetyltransferase
MWVMVYEWDPGSASPAAMAAALDLLNSVLAEDLPQDPAWRADRLREYLAVTMPGERRRCWMATGGPGALERGEVPLGHASVLLLDDIAVVELIVHPRHRRGGLGRSLLTAAARYAVDHGVPSLGVEVVGGTPAAGFFEANAFHCEFVEVRSVLDMAAVDWPRLGAMARGVSSGYRLEFHAGGPPDHLMASYARAKDLARDGADLGDLDLRPSSYDPERLRSSVDTLQARGLKPYIVVGIHERTGEVAGLTEVVVPAQRPTRADQYDTIVAPGHRGYGLSRAMKARMLFELRAAEPGLHDVQTWNAMGNDALLKVNNELGFVLDREWREYEADAADVLKAVESAGVVSAAAAAPPPPPST